MAFGWNSWVAPAFATLSISSPGSRGCIKGIPGSGKSFLLATLAAVLLARNHQTVAASAQRTNKFQVVYLSGHYFTETPFEVLKLSVAVSYGGDEAAVKEVMAIESCDVLERWLRCRPEQICFMLDDGDFLNERAESLEEAITLLNTVTAGMVLVYCARVGTSPDCDVTTTDYFHLMEGFDADEANCFLQHAEMRMEDHLLHCTGYVPRLLDTYCRGDLVRCLVGDYFMVLIDEFLDELNQSPDEWRQVLEVLAGGELGSLRNAPSGGFLYRNKDGRGACLCEAMRQHACLRAVEYTKLGAEEMLQAWLKPVLAAEFEAPTEAPWNCTMAVATVLRLREAVHLAAVGQLMVPRIVQALSEWWIPCWNETVNLNSSPMAWPVITVAMYGKAFVLQAGIREDLDPLRNYENKCKFLRKVSEACYDDDSCHTYFVWIGCFGEHVKDGVVINYGSHTDVFINYGQLDPLLSPLETKFQIPARIRFQCHYMLGGQRCNRSALVSNILCKEHASYNTAVSNASI